MLTLAEIAEKINAECHGDGNLEIDSIADLASAKTHQLSFITNPKYLTSLHQSKVAAIIVSTTLKKEIESDKSIEYLGSFLIVDDAYLGYAKAAQLLDNTPRLKIGIHPTASIAASAIISCSASIGALVSIGENCNISEHVVIESGSSIGSNSSIGSGSRIWSNVSVYHNVRIGNNAVIHSGAVIGADGFGFANDAGAWTKIPQLGGVDIGDDVEIGANSTIDRGALKDTKIGNCVKIDNIVHIAHNVCIGDQTAIAAMSGVAGSTTIGKNCTLAGRVSVIGHLNICDNVHISVATLITKSIAEPGVYSSGDVAMPNKQWKRKLVFMKKLEQLFSRVKQIEKDLKKN